MPFSLRDSPISRRTVRLWLGREPRAEGGQVGYPVLFQELGLLYGAVVVSWVEVAAEPDRDHGPVRQDDAGELTAGDHAAQRPQAPGVLGGELAGRRAVRRGLDARAGHLGGKRQDRRPGQRGPVPADVPCDGHGVFLLFVRGSPAPVQARSPEATCTAATIRS